MRRPGLALGIAVVAISLACTAATTSASASINDLRYLIGKWTCATKLPAMGKAPAHTEHTPIAFAWGPAGTTIVTTQLSPTQSGYGFIGWDSRKNVWWSTNVDNLGDYAGESGPNTPGTTVLTGWSYGLTAPVQSRDSITKLSATSFHDLYQYRKGAVWLVGADTTCTKR